MPARDANTTQTKLTNLSEFARLQHRLQSGSFMATLYKEGLDPVEFARIADRWSDRFAADPTLRAEYARVMDRTAEACATSDTKPLDIPDTLVLPGQRLAWVSDFARISRAAKRGEFQEALARAGVDAGTFANLCARFNTKMSQDPKIAATFERLLVDPRVD